MRVPRRSVVASGVLVVAAGTATAVAFGSDETEQPATTRNVPPATAEVTRQDLVQTQSFDGTLGYAEEVTLSGRLPGTLTWLPDEGAVISRGEVLYKVDGRAVPLLYGDLPLYRALVPGVEGEDVRVLEQNLRKLGYTGFTVDEEFTDNTGDAVEAWQEDLGVAESGTVEPGKAVVLEGAVRVAAHRTRPGAPAGRGTQILDVTSTRRVVTVQVSVQDQHLIPKDAAVTVTLPDGKSVEGTVAVVGTVVSESEGSGGEEPGAGPGSGEESGEATIEVSIALADPKAAGAWVQAPVDISVVSDEREGVLTVPVSALLALSEGGYGVELVEGGTSETVAVETGMFADGRVEVTGELAEGNQVGVPRP